MELKDYLEKIKAPDENAMTGCRIRWDAIAKPLHGMGRLEDAVVQIAGITGTADVRLDKKLLITMCADNGVVCEGVSQSGPEVTKAVADNFASGKTSSCIIAGTVGADVWAVDIGVKDDTLIENRKIARGTRNIAEGPAMTREEALAAISIGIEKVCLAAEQGFSIIAAGEMGIANTATSSAVTAVLTGNDPADVTGRGAGLDDERLKHKIEIIRKAIDINLPDQSDPLDVLRKVGGFDIAGMTGIFIGCAYCRIPAVTDGFISSVAALIAVRMCPQIKAYILPSHRSEEPGAQIALSALGMEAYLELGMHLGEGTGAVCLFPMLDIALAVYQGMPTFNDIHVEQYKDYEAEKIPEQQTEDTVHKTGNCCQERRLR